MTPAPRTLPRRTVLAASGTAVLAVAAACSSATTANTTSAASAAQSAASSAKGAVTSAASSAKAAASSAAGSVKQQVPSAAAADPTTTAEATPTGTVIASVADVTAAGSMSATAPSGPVILAASNGTVVCHTAICTHQQCTVAASGSCPCHGSQFNVTTGAVENGPAQQPLAEVPVTISGGQVYAT